MTVARSLRTLATLVQFTLIITNTNFYQEFEDSESRDLGNQGIRNSRREGNTNTNFYQEFEDSEYRDLGNQGIRNSRREGDASAQAAFTRVLIKN